MSNLDKAMRYSTATTYISKSVKKNVWSHKAFMMLMLVSIMVYGVYMTYRVPSKGTRGVVLLSTKEIVGKYKLMGWALECWI